MKSGQSFDIQKILSGVDDSTIIDTPTTIVEKNIPSAPLSTSHNNTASVVNQESTAYQNFKSSLSSYGGGKVGMGLIEALKNKNKFESANKAAVVECTQEFLDNEVQKYIQTLAASGKDLVKTQLQTAKFTVLNSYTIQCESALHLQFNTINSIKQDLTDHFIKVCNNPSIKILTILNEDNSVQDVVKVLTKNEIFEEIANKYPVIRLVKEELHMSIVGNYPYEVEEIPVQDVITEDITFDENGLNIDDNSLDD